MRNLKIFVLMLAFCSGIIFSSVKAYSGNYDCSDYENQVAVLRDYVRTLGESIQLYQDEIAQIWGNHYAAGTPLDQVRLDTLNLLINHLTKLREIANQKIRDWHHECNEKEKRDLREAFEKG